MKKTYLLLFLGALLTIVGWGPFLLSQYNNSSDNNSEWLNKKIKVINSQTDINPNVLKVGLTAYLKARQKGLDSRELLTLVDYSQPSSAKRLWVLDLNRNKVLMNTWVSHGKNSGALNATSFSNANSSLKSSIGVFITQDSYSGKHGISLRIQGLERGINDHAYSRAVVFHGAEYVNSERAKNGAIGRSWGCLAVSPNVIAPLVRTIKNNTLVVAYYPDRHWLNNSSYLT